MPVTKASRRSAVAREKRARQLEKKAAKQADLSHLQLTPGNSIVERKGTGSSAAPGAWDTCKDPDKKHKLIIPAHRAGEKLVLLAGDSNLRSLVFQKLLFPEDVFLFGISCMDGATASHLVEQLKEDRAVLVGQRRDPSLLCLLAPFNAPFENATIGQSAEAFAQLLKSAKETWGKVCVVDFPPCLSFNDEYQTALRKEYHRIAVACDVLYHEIAQHFSMSNRSLWVKDGTHLSDKRGLPILMEQVWTACNNAFERPPPSPPKLPFTTDAKPRRCPSPPVPVSAPPPAVSGRVSTRSHARRVHDISPDGFEHVGPQMEPSGELPETEPEVDTKTTSLKRGKAEDENLHVKRLRVSERLAATRRHSSESSTSSAEVPVTIASLREHHCQVVFKNEDGKAMCPCAVSGHCLSEV